MIIEADYGLSNTFRFVANVKRSPNELYFSATNTTPVVQTAAYRDVVAMQKTLLLVYLPLPMLLAMLVSEVNFRSRIDLPH